MKMKEMQKEIKPAKYTISYMPAPPMEPMKGFSKSSGKWEKSPPITTPRVEIVYENAQDFEWRKKNKKERRKARRGGRK